MNFKAGMLRHVFQRQIKGYKKRKFLSKVISRLKPRMASSYSDECGVYNKLEDVGFSPLPGFLSKEKIENIIGFLNDKEVYDRYDREQKLFKADKPPAYARTGAYLDKDIVNCPHVLDIANSANVLSVVGRVLGCKPTISNITIWNSYPNEDKTAQHSENFHRDVDDFDFVKLFIYLTNVTDEEGPHVFVDYSHKDESFLDIQRYADEEIESHYGKDKIRVIPGSAGDAFLENTYGLHKGTVPQKGMRTLLQVEYTLLSIGAYSYPCKFDASSNTQYDDYINRLYVK
tara:strand:- start:19836 stop:20696 length:861 start_codon:yes stop_codon:yes gene_type:complete